MSKAAFVMSIVALSVSAAVLAFSILDFLIKMKKSPYIDSIM